MDYFLRFGYNHPIVYRAGVVISCVTAYMQQELLDRVVSNAKSGTFCICRTLFKPRILKARNELKQRGLIDFRERGTKAIIYKLTMLNSVQNSKQNGVQESTIANSTQVIANSVQESTQAISSIYIKDKRQPPISPMEHF